MNRIIIICLLITCSISLQAQDKRDKVRERIESKKIAFLSDKLMLTPEEAQSFWPVYNEFQKSMREARPHMRGERSEIDDDSASTMLDDMIINEQKTVDLKKVYVGKFKKILGPKKTLLLLRYDRKFKEDMIRNIKDRRRDKEHRNR